MDFVTDLPLSGPSTMQGEDEDSESSSAPTCAPKYDSILVVTDRMTKMAHYIPCNKTTNAPTLADLFVRYVWCHHGLPDSIISDRGTQFTSKFWTALCKRLRIDRRLSTAFHPQTDGQTE